MKNLLFFSISLLIFSYNLFSQKSNCDSICEDAIYVKTDNYEGVILGPKCFNFQVVDKFGNNMDFDIYDYMWKPTLEDVYIAEKLIKEYVIKKSKKTLVNQGNGCPIIYQNFNKYIRQYSGRFNKKGQKILEVNFIWKEYIPNYWKCGPVGIMDGCSYFWDISVNMKKRKCFNYCVNGIG